MTIGGVHNTETKHDETDNVKSERWLHKDSDIVSVLVVKGLVEVNADHYEES